LLPRPGCCPRSPRPRGEAMPVIFACTDPACAARRSVLEGSAPSFVRCPRCGRTMVPAPASARPGPARSGRYEVRGELGAGAFGTVYRAYDPHLEREVALKVLARDTLSSPQAVERFQREARAAARMLHPHIVPVYDAGKHEDVYYIASALI